jgi:threonine dehydrogenase-like Zn-dependent dehydrogenase
MNRISVIFQEPGRVFAAEEPLPPMREQEVRVRTRLSAISAGTELRIYRGEIPLDWPLDSTLEALSGEFRYPLRYGYALVGTVEAVGDSVDPVWLGRSVFAFYPHCSVFCARPESLIALPSDLDPLDALFLPNTETAVGFMLDGRPKIGERCVVFGQGIVGLLTTALLKHYPLEAIVTLDRYRLRREASMAAGASESLDPDDSAGLQRVLERLESDSASAGADLIFELSGSPQALDQAISFCGFHSRVIVGSWYGTHRAEVDLGRDFHRKRIRLISSQVSTVAPENTGRWSKKRQLQQALGWVRKLRPSRWITQQFDVRNVKAAYRMLDECPDGSLQIVLTYDEAGESDGTGPTGGSRSRQPPAKRVD